MCQEVGRAGEQNSETTFQMNFLWNLTLNTYHISRMSLSLFQMVIWVVRPKTRFSQKSHSLAKVKLYLRKTKSKVQSHAFGSTRK